MKKKILACMLAVAMCVGVSPITTYAEEAVSVTESTEAAQETESVQATRLAQEENEVAEIELKAEAVCKIGNTEYASLQDAIDAVGEGQTIQMTADVPNAEGIVVPSGKNFTLDFAEHTYTLSGPGVGSTGSETNGFQLLMNSNLIFKNGTINYEKGQTTIKRMFQSYANVTFDNMDFYTKYQSPNGSNPSELYAFSFCNGNVVFTGDTNIISDDKNTVSFIAGNYADYPATHVVFDENFMGSVNSIMEYSGPNTTNYSMTIMGQGTFGGLKTTKGDDPNGFKIKSGTFATVDCLNYVTENANINIKLDADVNSGITIPENTTVNLDLNGYAINGKQAKNTAAIKNNGMLVVDDTSENQTGTVKREDTAENTGSSSYYVIDNQGIMTIKGGAFTNNSGKLKEPESTTYVGSSLVRNGGEKAAVLNVEDGTFSQDNFIVIKNDDHGTLNMTGGVIVTKNPSASAIQNWAAASVTGGKVEGMIWTATWSNDLPDSKTTLGGSVDVTGEIRAGYNDKGYGNKKNSNVVIEGGTYDVTFSTQTPDGQDEGKGMSIEVSNGSFSNANALPYVTDTNAAVFQNGKYVVMSETEAVNGAVGYVEVDGEKVYITDKKDVENIGGENTEVKDTTDYRELEELAEEGKKFIASDYTTDSFAAFELLLKDAEKVLNDKNSTQAEVNDLVARLQKAKENLVLIQPELPVEHNVKYVAGKQATCTADGNIEYWYCEECGKYFRDKECTKEITKEETVIKATGHKLTEVKAKAATCTKDGNIAYWYCENCKRYYRDAEGAKEITKAGTVVKATGHKYQDGKCVICGKAEPAKKPNGSETEKDKNQTKPTAVKTGDNSMIRASVLGVVIGAAVIIAVLVLRRKRKDK